MCSSSEIMFVGGGSVAAARFHGVMFFGAWQTVRVKCWAT